MRVMIATHGKMASGVKNTLSLFIGTDCIETVDAYMDDRDYTPEIQRFIDETKEEEVSIIFTDLIGGSVNQKVMQLNQKPNVKIISGFNIALLMEVILSDLTEDDELERALEAARGQMQLVKMEPVSVQEETEEDFF